MSRTGVKLSTPLWRGLKRQCPCCGQASAFRGYLKVVDACRVCDTPLSLYPTDDGPAYITILLVGHLVLAPALMLHVFSRFPAAETAFGMVGVMAALTLLLLPFVKGAFLGLLWFLGLKAAR